MTVVACDLTIKCRRERNLYLIVVSRLAVGIEVFSLSVNEVDTECGFSLQVCCKDI